MSNTTKYHTILENIDGKEVSKKKIRAENLKKDLTRIMNRVKDESTSDMRDRLVDRLTALYETNPISGSERSSEDDGEIHKSVLKNIAEHSSEEIIKATILSLKDTMLTSVVGLSDSLDKHNANETIKSDVLRCFGEIYKASVASMAIYAEAIYKTKGKTKYAFTAVEDTENCSESFFSPNYSFLTYGPLINDLAWYCSLDESEVDKEVVKAIVSTAQIGALGETEVDLSDIDKFYKSSGPQRHRAVSRALVSLVASLDIAENEGVDISDKNSNLPIAEKARIKAFRNMRAMLIDSILYVSMDLPIDKEFVETESCECLSYALSDMAMRWREKSKTDKSCLSPFSSSLIRKIMKKKFECAGNNSDAGDDVSKRILENINVSAIKLNKDGE